MKVTVGKRLRKLYLRNQKQPECKNMVRDYFMHPEAFVEYLDKPVKVYNFEVEDWHTYFVSEYNVFVHNAGCGDNGVGGKSKKIKNSAGKEVERRLVKDQNELLGEAEKAAGGSLDSYENYKPSWWKSKNGDMKIEWEPAGHSNTNEGPHVTIRQKTPEGKWRVIEKIFIEGQETY